MNKIKKVIIRTDASLLIGSGHVMRCLTLAEALRESGTEVQFICRKLSGNLIELVCKKEFIVHELSDPCSQELQTTVPVAEKKNVYTHWLGTTQEHDAFETVEAFQEKRLDLLIVDHYALGEIWETKMRPHADNIMVIDDLADRTHDCDLLLDHGLFPNFESRYDSLLPRYCKKLLGPRYVMLSSEYSNLNSVAQPRKNFNNLLIFFGGSDLDNLTGRALNIISELSIPNLNIDVVIGGSNLHRRTIQNLGSNLLNVIVYEPLPSLAKLMLKADFGLGSGGMVTYERICLKLPSVAVAISRNQEKVVKYLHEKFIQCELKKDFTKKDLINSFNEVKNLDLDLMTNIVDGLGVERVLEELRK